MLLSNPSPLSYLPVSIFTIVKSQAMESVQRAGEQLFMEEAWV